ncbi:MAG: serine/threonine-protein kinase, partial [Planctomycetota bacterium]
ADDLKLGQSVALKFLPDTMARDPKWLARFNREVRIARQVSHPNVCRVYDIGEVNGEHYISMEFVDGEDLVSLLRRIGRLPEDKALEIAHQLCVGLAAAHEMGVLHRDLKPANIMLDGRGRVRITDFGVAALADRLDEADETAGTPAYMAPEVLAGEPATKRSDIYALGLVLYEVFTGRAVIDSGSLAEVKRRQERETPATPSSLVGGIDPAVERVILKCLEKAPRDRPASAIAVAAALPGGDPLAAALAAGETPSPEMVAASGETDTMSPRVAVASIVLLAVSVALTAVFSAKVSLWPQLLLDKPPAALVDRAKDLFRQLGYANELRDSVFSFQVDWNFVHWVRHQVPRSEQQALLGQARPAATSFWYRESPAELEPARYLPGSGPVDMFAPLREGEREAWVDQAGRLRGLHVAVPHHPAEVEGDQTPGTVDWVRVFELAGLDFGSFTPIEAELRYRPMLYADEHHAWTGVHTEPPFTPMRVEAASADGRVVSFSIRDLWDEDHLLDARPEPGWIQKSVDLIYRSTGAIILLLLVGAALLARRNLQSGRSDRRGAARLALGIFGCLAVAYFVGAPNIIPLSVRSVFWRLGAAVWVAMVSWVSYLALEPYARRLWPASLVSWGRLIRGQWRDPLVGKAVLIGVVAGAASASLYFVQNLVLEPFGRVPPRHQWMNWLRIENLRGLRFTVADWLEVLSMSFFFGFVTLLLLVLLRGILRQGRIAGLVWILVVPALVYGPTGSFYPLSVAMTAVALILLLRYGVLSLILYGFTISVTLRTPLLLDFAAWHAYGVAITVIGLGSLAVWGYSAATARRLRLTPRPA